MERHLIRLLFALALTVFVALGLFQPCPSLAQQHPKDQVPFKFTTVVDGEGFFIPVNPPILSVNLSGKGQAAPLGQYTLVAHNMADIHSDGSLEASKDGVGAFTAVKS